MKKHILQTYENFDFSIIDGTIPEVIEKLKKLELKCEEKLIEHNYVSFKLKYDIYGDGNFIEFYRLETDKEYQDRLDAEDRKQLEKTILQKQYDQRDFALYQKLKKKFEK